MNGPRFKNPKDSKFINMVNEFVYIWCWLLCWWIGRKRTRITREMLEPKCSLKLQRWWSCLHEDDVKSDAFTQRSSAALWSRWSETAVVYTQTSAVCLWISYPRDFWFKSECQSVERDGQKTVCSSNRFSTFLKIARWWQISSTNARWWTADSGHH